jgi:hypothetical protein
MSGRSSVGGRILSITALVRLVMRRVDRADMQRLCHRRGGGVETGDQGDRPGWTDFARRHRDKPLIDRGNGGAVLVQLSVDADGLRFSPRRSRRPQVPVAA